MKFYGEISLRNFNFWSGGKDTAEALSLEEIDTVESMLEDAYPDGMEDTAINDFFWFERDTIAEWLGYRNADAMFDGDKDDWSEHYTSILTEKYGEDKEERITEWVDNESEGNMDDSEVFEAFADWYAWCDENLEEEED